MSPSIDGSAGGSALLIDVDAPLPEASSPFMRADRSVDETLAASGRFAAEGRHREGSELADAVLAGANITLAQQARARELLALHRLRLGDFAASVHNGLRALEFLVTSGDLPRLSKLHCTLALAYHETALNEPALRHVLAALEAARAGESASAEFWALSRSAMVHEAMGDPGRGVELGRKAFDLARGLDDPEIAFAASNNLGDTYLEVARGQRLAGVDPGTALTEGIAYVREAVSLAQKQGHSFYESLARTNLVSLLTELGQYTEAREQAARARKLARDKGYRNLEINNDAQLAIIVRAEGNLDEATAMMDAQLKDPSSEGDLELLATLHRALFEMHKASGRFEQALQHYEELHELTFRMTQQTAGLQARMLINTIEIEQARHEAERARFEAQMERIRAEEFSTEAKTDPLTLLPNRRALDGALPAMIARARDTDEPLSAAMIDFDHFKLVNDSFGHGVGDQVLIAMSALLHEVTRESDLAVRMGGEEFLLVFADTRRDRAAQACERLLDAVRRYPWDTLGVDLDCTVSVGVAQWQPGETTSHWVARADSALYASKRGGRDQVSTDPL